VKITPARVFWSFVLVLLLLAVGNGRDSAVSFSQAGLGAVGDVIVALFAGVKSMFA
jgi:hypothetical protein